MITLPRFTLITPSFNQGRYIDQTIRSVLDQQYPDLQHIVMDGGSTDETLGILHKYDGQIQWVSEADRGQSHAINKGLHQATGDILGYLNSDDLLEPEALLKVGLFFAGNPQAAWVTGRCRTVDQYGREIRKAITSYKNFWLHFRSYKVLTVLNYISQPATFWRREVVDRVGNFNERWNYAMEYDYWLRVGQHYRLCVLDDYLASFRVHSTSKAGASANAQFDTELEIVRSQVTSPVAFRLHALHGSVIVSVYRRLLARGT